MWLSNRFALDPILVGIGEFTTHFSPDFSGDWDVHWGYDPRYDCGSKMGTLVSGNVDQNLRSPGGLILTHTHMEKP